MRSTDLTLRDEMNLSSIKEIEQHTILKTNYFINVVCVRIVASILLKCTKKEQTHLCRHDARKMYIDVRACNNL